MGSVDTDKERRKDFCEERPKERQFQHFLAAAGYFIALSLISKPPG